MAEPILTHKVVNIDKVGKKYQHDLAWYEQNYEANAKYDGCFAFVFLGESGVKVESRTGEHFTSCNEQAAYLAHLLRNEIKEFGELCLLAEAWSPDHDFATSSGMFRKGVQNLQLQLVVFDCLTTEEFMAGHSPVGFAERMGRLRGKLENPAMWRGYVMGRRAQRWAPGTYDALRLTAELTSDPRGFDGLILADQNGTWTAGRGTTGEKVRIKKGLSFDLRVTGVYEGVGEKTGRAVYTISVDYKGQTLMVGSGIPHDFARVPKVGDIVEIVAMDYSSKGLLREPRYKGIRHDKTEADA